jgi:hypothetical protein
MSEQKGLGRLLKGARILAKILLITVFYLAILCAPLLAKDAVTSAYSGFDANTPFDFAGIPNTVFNLLFIGFAALIGGLFLVNLIFRLFDENKVRHSDRRRSVQVLLNVFVILGGVLYFAVLELFSDSIARLVGNSNMAASGLREYPALGWEALVPGLFQLFFVFSISLVCSGEP